MLARIVEARRLVAIAVAAAAGVWGLHAYPFRSDDVFLALIQIRKPVVFHAFAYGYATLWFTTPFFLMSLMTSVLAIAIYRRAPAARFRGLPAYPKADTRPAPMLVLGETHLPTS